MLTKDPVEREKYEARLKVLRDEASRMKGAREEGKEEGRKKGREEGSRGALIDTIHNLQRVLNKEATPADDLQRQSVDELRALTQALFQEISRFVPGTSNGSAKD